MKESSFSKLVTDKLILQHFAKKKFFYIRELNQDCYGTIGFIVATHQSPGVLYVNPVIGVFNKTIENVYCKITGYDSIKTYQPTISSPIGYLMPQNKYYEWEYSDHCNVENVITEMLITINEYGLPFMDKYKSPYELLNCMEENKYIIRSFIDMKLPILYSLLGEKQKAKEIVNILLEKHKKNYQKYLQETGRTNPDDERYFSFAEKFNKVIYDKV